MLAVSLVCSISGSAQNQKMENLQKKLDEANEIANSANEIANTAKNIFGMFKRKKNNTEESDVTDVAMSGELSSAGEAFRIVTNHPDFKIKVLRCEASGSTCVIDMIFENIGSQDVGMTIYGGNYGEWRSVAYDDEANRYDNGNLKVSIANKPLTVMYINSELPAGIPLKARVQIEGVKASATMFRRIDLGITCNSWDIDSAQKKVKFFNVPISREGDE